MSDDDPFSELTEDDMRAMRDAYREDAMRTAAQEAARDVVPEATVKPPTLAQKLVNIMASVGRVEKRGKSAFHNYKYATEADVAEAVRGVLITERVVLLPSLLTIATRGEGKQSITQVVMRYTLINADDPRDTLSYDMPGEGQDVGDKGPYKAVTGSEKYALMKLLLIPTGDDPEKDGDGEPAGDGKEARQDEPEGDPDPKPAPPPRSRNRSGNPCTAGQVKLLYARLKNANVRKEALCERFSLERLEDMPFASVNDALAWIGQGEG
jgi:ERF superfamily.